MKLRVCRILSLMIITTSVFAQSKKTEWKLEEEFLQTQRFRIQNAKDLRQLGSNIKMHFPDTLSRLKAAYLWVTRSIRYDCEGSINKNSRWALDSVLNSRKAVCAGYVNVFRNLCDAAGVECVDIGGYGRSGFESLIVNIDSPATNHTWNAVRVGGKWELIDITWASGYTNEDCTDFTFHRNDWYFCSDPAQFAWDHYPKDQDWQLLDTPVSWNEFYRYPLLYQGLVEKNIEDFYPRSVIINKNVGDTIEFKFKSAQSVNQIILRSRKYKEIYRMDTPQRIRDGYRYIYRIERAGSYDLQIDLLSVERRNSIGSYNIQTFTDIVYWVNAVSANKKP